MRENDLFKEGIGPCKEYERLKFEEKFLYWLWAAFKVGVCESECVRKWKCAIVEEIQWDYLGCRMRK
jgi:hypothetical protein